MLLHAPKCNELEEEDGNLGTELFSWQLLEPGCLGSELLLGQSVLGFILCSALLPRKPEASVQTFVRHKETFLYFPALVYNK